MKLVLVLLFVVSANVFSKNLKWSSLYKDSTYSLTQQIDITDTRKEDFSILAESKLKLIQSTALPMINVQLFKFELPSCPSNSMKTELELLELPQANQKIVVIGFDIVENCILEIFIEQKDLYSKSIFK
jgi:hypothetical protein